MSYEAEIVDVIVIGGGHAGCEAALASARLGKKTIMFTINIDSIAMMPCNPNIGGSSKGHLVREIDALGGEMGKNIDKSYIQSRMLNVGKGPAVYSLRAQADKVKYANEMKLTLQNTNNLFLIQDEVINIIVEGKVCKGVITQSGAIYRSKSVVICGGTYFKSRCIYGETIIESGPNGLKSSISLSNNLQKYGLRMYRFKTGSPARIDKRFVDFSKMEIQNGDEHVVPFSFENTEDKIKKEQIPCWLTYTNEETHKIIKENLHRSPMFNGVIDGTATRYCPSIEDKIVRFKDKNRHQVFIEPEGEETNEMYVQGMSSSLPEDIQKKMYATIPGLENCRFIRTAYAIEYDCIDATQLDLSLKLKTIDGLFFAGQINGSSGYEEAAAQGIVAGINASLFVENKEPIIIDRSEAYIGVLIDDLVTKGTKEPYRMMTSRAEYRLLLRQDNADLRLTEKGYKVGLINQNRYNRFINKKNMIEEEINRVSKVIIPPSIEANNFLKQNGCNEIITGTKLNDLIKRPELNYEKLSILDINRTKLPEDVKEQVNIQIKYEGYINRQLIQVEQFKKMENKLIPREIEYENINGLRLEARQKLKEIRPLNIGHASRITGVSPADISVLLVYLQVYKKSI